SLGMYRQKIQGARALDLAAAELAALVPAQEAAQPSGLRIALGRRRTGWQAVEYGQPAAAVAHEYFARSTVDPNVVGVVAKIGAAGCGEICSLVALHGSVTGAGDVNGIRGREVGHPLRQVQPGDPMHDRALIGVEDRDAVVAKLRDDEAPALRVIG